MLAGAKYGLEQIPERWLGRLDGVVVEEIQRQTEKLVLVM
jgi:ADP-ribosyl-[dinitrogen reductase] hydrolase